MKKLTLFITILTGIFLAPFALAETINVNIGTRTSEEGIVSTVTGNDAGIFTLTLNNTVNSSILAYDKLIDSASSSYWITGVSNNIITVEDRLGAFTSPATNLFQSMRAYSTITLWEADLDNLNLYSSSADAIGNVYNDSVYDESVTIDGGATIPLNSITLTVPEGQRHNGTAGTGARIVASVARAFSATVAITLEWLEINGNGNGSNPRPAQHTSGTATLQYLIIHKISDNVSAVTGIRIDDAANLHNSIIYDIESTVANGMGRGVHYNAEPADVSKIQNVTVHNIRGGATNGTAYCFGGYNYANLTLKNNLGTDPSVAATLACFGSFTNSTTATNASSDSTAPSPIAAEPVVSSVEFVSTVVGSENLHLKSGAESIDAGTDLGTTPTGVNIDIDNQNHGAGAVWDIGADEYTNFIWSRGGLRTRGGIWAR